MRHQLYQTVPNWMSESLNKKKCSKCEFVLNKTHINGVGLHEAKDGDTTMCLDYTCPKCSYAARLTFEMFVKTSVEQVCFLLLDEIQKKKSLSKSKSIEKNNTSLGPITTREVKSFVNKMNKSETMDDFLNLIGAKGYQDELKKSDQIKYEG